MTSIAHALIKSSLVAMLFTAVLGCAATVAGAPIGAALGLGRDARFDQCHP